MRKAGETVVWWAIGFLAGGVSGRHQRWLVNLSNIELATLMLGLCCLLAAVTQKKWIFLLIAFIYSNAHTAPFLTISAQAESVKRSSPQASIAVFYGQIFEIAVGAKETYEPFRIYSFSHPIFGRLYHATSMGAKPIAATFAEKNSLKPWLQAILLGQKRGLSRAIKKNFKASGLYHLLVVSGLHISMLAWGFCFLLKAIANLLYSLKFISAAMFPRLVRCIEYFVVLACALYCHCVLGWTIPSQRAFLCLALAIFAKNSCLLSLKERIGYALFIQSVIFTVGFLSISALMSWGTYLLVIAGSKAAPGSNLFIRLVTLQIRITIFMAAICGIYAPVAVAANLLLVPVFPAVLFTGLLIAAGWRCDLFIWIHNKFFMVY